MPGRGPAGGGGRDREDEVGDLGADSREGGQGGEGGGDAPAVARGEGVGAGDDVAGLVPEEVDVANERRDRLRRRRPRRRDAQPAGEARAQALAGAHGDAVQTLHAVRSNVKLRCTPMRQTE